MTYSLRLSIHSKGRWDVHVCVQARTCDRECVCERDCGTSARARMHTSLFACMHSFEAVQQLEGKQRRISSNPFLLLRSLLPPPPTTTPPPFFRCNLIFRFFRCNLVGLYTRVTIRLCTVVRWWR